MAEDVGEPRDGYTFSQFGWVLKFNLLCLKPPILFGDTSSPRTMTATNRRCPSAPKCWTWS